MDMEQAVLAQLNDAQSPPPAANPSPGAGGPPPSHPSYVEMITAAIQWGSSQGKEGGSSKRAIAKYIDRVYTNLPASHSALLTHHLKRLKNSGQLVMVKNSYQLSSSSLSLSPPSPPPTRSAPVAAPVVPDLPAPVGSTPKRGPGRPPKLKPAVPVPVPMPMPVPISSDPVVDNGSGSGFGSEPAKKRRGRPPKQVQEGAVATEVPFVQPISEVRPNVVNGEVTSGHKRRPGRPPKLQAATPLVPFAAAASEQVNVEEVTAKRRPGRPPKVKASSVSVLVGPGPERLAEGSVRPRGRPRKNVMGPVVSRPVGKRPRGRPRKMGGGAVSGGALGVGVGMGMGMRRGRGRPPKGGGPPMVRRRPGRPVGRPRKDASILRNHTAGQEVANEELLRKFELIQSKIREAVIVIRPCVADESAALTALQQLEELATMDLTAPPNAPPSPPETMTIPQSTNGGPPTPAVPVSIAPASTASPTANVSAPFMGAPFTVTVSPMNVSAPFHAAPSGMETQHPMSWFSSNEGQS